MKLLSATDLDDLDFRLGTSFRTELDALIDRIDPNLKKGFWLDADTFSLSEAFDLMTRIAGSSDESYACLRDIKAKINQIESM